MWGFLHITASAFNFLTHSFFHCWERADRVQQNGEILKQKHDFSGPHDAPLMEPCAICLDYTAVLERHLEPADMAQTCTL